MPVGISVREVVDMLLHDPTRPSIARLLLWHAIWSKGKGTAPLADGEILE